LNDFHNVNLLSAHNPHLSRSNDAADTPDTFTGVLQEAETTAAASTIIIKLGEFMRCGTMLTRGKTRCLLLSIKAV